MYMYVKSLYMYICISCVTQSMFASQHYYYSVTGQLYTCSERSSASGDLLQ